MVRVRRVYEPPDPQDGFRVLVDRLWPRGLRKDAARVDLWPRELAPSDGLRRWFGHDPSRWEDFRKRYREELGRPEVRAALDSLVQKARQGTVTLLFAPGIRTTTTRWCWRNSWRSGCADRLALTTGGHEPRIAGGWAGARADKGG